MRRSAGVVTFIGPPTMAWLGYSEEVQQLQDAVILAAGTLLWACSPAVSNEVVLPSDGPVRSTPPPTVAGAETTPASDPAPSSPASPAPAGTPEPAPPGPPSAEPRWDTSAEARAALAAWEVFGRAVEDREGDAVAALVTPGTIAMFEERRRLALHADRGELERRSTSTQHAVLLLRQAMDPRRLEALDGRGVVAASVEAGWADTRGDAEARVARIEGDVAVFRFVSDGRVGTTDVPMMRRVEGVWRVDIAGQVRLFDRIMDAANAHAARLRGVSVGELLLSTVAESTGEEATDALWVPPFPQTARAGGRAPSRTPGQQRTGEVPAEAQVVAAWERYRRALRERDGAAVAAMVTPSTLEFFDRLRSVALHAGPEHLRGTGAIPIVTVLALRQRVDAGRLASMDGRGACAAMVDDGWFPVRADSELRVDRVAGDTAFVSLTNGGRVQVSDAPLLRRVDGQWRLDVERQIAAEEPGARRGLEEMARRQGTGREAALLTAVGAMTGHEATEALWTPPRPR